MGLFGSLFTGVSALAAQSQNTAIISNNIANVNTVGFKRSEASFFSLVTTQNSNTRYSPGTVTANRIQHVAQQGSISQTSSATDAAISGNGMFAVKQDANDSALSQFYYTRSGQFQEDSSGYLKNSAGFYLYGWPIDSNGDLPANQGDLASLVPVDVAFLGGLTRPTSTAQLSINLDAGETDTLITNALASTNSPDFTRGLTVYDSLGNAQALTFEFTKVYGPHATTTSSLNNLQATDTLVGDLGMTDGDTFTLAVDAGAPVTFEIDNDSVQNVAGSNMVQTVGEIIDAINGLGAGVTASLGNSGELLIQRDDFTATTESFTLANGIGSPLGGLGLTANTYNSFDIDTSSYSNGASTDTPPYSLNADFPTPQLLPGDTGYNRRGWWQVVVKDPFDDTITQGLINFNQDGTINASSDSNGNIDISLQNIDFGNGSEPADISVDVERFSQFSSDYTVLFSDQNGAELGLRTGVEIDRNGYVVAQFSNGATSTLYKLPLVTFAATDNLTEASGTAYTKNEASGEDNLREAGSGGAGFLEPSTLENSNVDLADEFALLIVAQRAYSAGTKVINTVDQMTQELLQLR